MDSAESKSLQKGTVFVIASHMSRIIDIISFLKFMLLGRSLCEVSHEVILSLSMMQWLDMDIAMDNLRRGIFMWCFFILWQIMLVDGVSVGLMRAMITPSLLMYCWSKVHCRRSYYHVLRMVHCRRSHCHVLRMVYVMIEIQEVSDWVMGGILSGMLKHDSRRVHVVLFMLNKGGWR